MPWTVCDLFFIRLLITPSCLQCTFFMENWVKWFLGDKQYLRPCLHLIVTSISGGCSGKQTPLNTGVSWSKKCCDSITQTLSKCSVNDHQFVFWTTRTSYNHPLEFLRLIYIIVFLSIYLIFTLIYFIYYAFVLLLLFISLIFLFLIYFTYFMFHVCIFYCNLVIWIF